MDGCRVERRCGECLARLGELVLRQQVVDLLAEVVLGLPPALEARELSLGFGDRGRALRVVGILADEVGEEPFDFRTVAHLLDHRDELAEDLPGVGPLLHFGGRRGGFRGWGRGLGFGRWSRRPRPGWGGRQVGLWSGRRAAATQRDGEDGSAHHRSGGRREDDVAPATLGADFGNAAACGAGRPSSVGQRATGQRRLDVL